MDEKPYQATPYGTLLEQIMNSSIAKSEREWVAAREIETLRVRLSEKEKEVVELTQEYKELQELKEQVWDAGVKAQKECERLRDSGHILAMRVLQSDIQLDDCEMNARDTLLLPKQALEGE